MSATDTIDVAALVERVVRDFRAACTDWDGSIMLDGEEPRFIPNCGYMREIATALQSQADALAEARREREIAERNRDAGRHNFHTMQQAAAVLKARAITAEASLATMREALEELANLMDDVVAGEYEPDSFTTQPARRALGGSNAE